MSGASESMKLGWRGFVEVVHVAALGVWLGVVVMAGVFAAIVFPTMSKLGARLPAFAEYPGDHSLIAAGRVAKWVFFAGNLVQLLCGLVVVTSVLVVHGWLKRVTPVWRRVARLLTVLLASSCMLYNVAVLWPRMIGNLDAYWTAAAAGRIAEADGYRDAFRADHPLATRALGLTAVGLVLCVGAVGWSWAKKGEGAEGEGHSRSIE